LARNDISSGKTKNAAMKKIAGETKPYGSSRLRIDDERARLGGRPGDGFGRLSALPVVTIQIAPMTPVACALPGSGIQPPASSPSTLSRRCLVAALVRSGSPASEAEDPA